MAYWRDKGYSNLPSGNALIDQLAIAMNTDPDNYSTPWDSMPTGIKKVAADAGYSNWSSWHDGFGRSNSTYDKFTNEIFNNRTILAHFIDSSVYGNHSVAGVGYRFDDYQQWLIIHDTWDTTTRKYIDYASTVIGNNRWTYVRP